jgi:hypothetical protein
MIYMQTLATEQQMMMRPRPYARRMGIHWRTFYEYLYTGAIPYYKFRGILLVDVAEADRIIRSGLQRIDAGFTKPKKAKTGKAS